MGELKQTYVDFWYSIETMRIHLSTGTSLRHPYSSSYSRVLLLEELLSFPEVQTRVVWLGSDATPTQCGTADYTNRAFACFPYTFCTSFMSNLADAPENDFTIIALAEYLIILRFLIV